MKISGENMKISGEILWRKELLRNLYRILVAETSERFQNAKKLYNFLEISRNFSCISCIHDFFQEILLFSYVL